MMPKSKKYSYGQVILIILLVTAVGLTIGLSLVSRTISDVKISTQVADSSRAFSAAESGIETALKGAAIGGTGVINIGGASANYNVVKLGGDSNPLTLPNNSPGNTQSVWLVEHQADGSLFPTPTPLYTASSLELCWGPDKTSSDPNPIPAVEATLLYYSGGTYKIGKAAFDPSARGNNFTPASTSKPTDNFCNTGKKYEYILNLASSGTFGNSTGDTLVLLRLNPVYNTTDLVVKPAGGVGGNLPTEGKTISSTGTTTSGVARKLTVLQGYTTLPSFMDYTLFCSNCTQ